MRAGADPGVVNRAGHDAIFEAEVNGKEKVVEWLLTEGMGLDAGVRGGSGGGGAEEGDGMDELGEGVEGVEIGDEETG